MSVLDISRRQAVINLAIAMGAAFVGPHLFAAKSESAGAEVFSDADISLFDEMADTIIPDTDVPGAKAAGAGAVIAAVVRDCFAPMEREVFRTGFLALLAAYNQRFGMPFLRGRPEERLAFLNEYQRALRERGAASREREEPALRCFRHLRQLTIMAYFTSEIGCTQALRFTEVPSGFDGDAAYSPGDRNWFTEVR